MHRVFLLSPANAAGKRAELMFDPRARFALARQLQRGEALPLGEIFSFVSGLYFRGKLAYAKAYGRPPDGAVGAYIITSNRGLVGADTPTTLRELRRFGRVPIDAADHRYRRPLVRSLRALAAHNDTEFVLLGSISTGKYVDVLLECLAERLLFPGEFVGRGDMSRGGLMLRCVRDGRELEYLPVAGATRRGKRPPRLAPSTWRDTPWDLRPMPVEILNPPKSPAAKT